MSALDSPANLNVSPSLDWLGRCVGNHTPVWIKAGNLETKLMAGDLDDIAVKEPVYVCGLARAGSTILLEALAAHPQTASHRYQDFPFLFTPYWWNLLLNLMPWRKHQKRERAHGDRIIITGQSPEAMEEMLWMAFFPHLHKAERSEVLDDGISNPDFSKFYRDHIRKLLHVRGADRYVAKGNYNTTRMLYLASIFPDARFIVPVREPVSHVVSLMRQHERFSEVGAKDPRAVRHMSLAGHFEFGLNRMPIHTGDDKRMAKINECWASGDEVGGWALYWDAIYRFVYKQLLSAPALKSKVLVVPYEELCANPKATLADMFAHSKLPVDEAYLESKAKEISAPDYYKSPLTEAQETRIRELTAETAELYGY